MTGRTEIRLALLFSLALTTAGCNSEPAEQGAAKADAASGSTGGTQASAPRDVCSFVTQDEISTAVGEKIARAEDKGESCSYHMEGEMASVDVEIAQSGGAEEMQVARDAARILGSMGSDMKGAKGAEGDLGQMLTGPNSTSGVGAEAFFGSNQQLHVLKNGVYFAVTPPLLSTKTTSGNPMLPAEKKREIATAVAQKIASRL